MYRIDETRFGDSRWNRYHKSNILLEKYVHKYEIQKTNPKETNWTNDLQNHSNVFSFAPFSFHSRNSLYTNNIACKLCNYFFKKEIKI